MNTTKLPRLNCLRCGHVWIKRWDQRPAHCARCNSPYWDKPRRQPKPKG